MGTSNTVALLTNFLPPYRLPVMRELRRICSDLQILLSTPMESGREWPTDWRGLSVQVQRNISWRADWHHPHHFVEPSTVHFPYDTLGRLRALKPSVVISGELGLRTLQAALYCLLFDSHLVIWATVSEFTEMNRGRSRVILRKLLLQRAAAVMVNGASGRRYIQSFGVAAKKVFCVPQTTDIEPFLNIPLERTEREQTRLLYSGRLIELKGLLPFIQELKQWAVRHPEQQLEFWFVGDGPLKTQLEALSCPESLSLRFLGHVPYEQLPAIYAQAGILVFPSFADEWGLVVVEALASGMPVLGSKYSQAVEDLIEDEENGWTFRPNDSGEIQSALDRALISSPTQLREAGIAARRSAQHLTPAAMASNISAALTYATAQNS